MLPYGLFETFFTVMFGISASVWGGDAYYLDGMSGGGMNSGSGWYSPSGVRITQMETH